MYSPSFISSLAEAGKIWLFCVAAALCYGIIHDQVTVRVCLEYFTIGHPTIFHTTNPTFLALGWGVIATWWVGAIGGIPTVVVMRTGKRPPWHVRQVVRPFLIYLGSVGLAAGLFGVLGYLLAHSALLRLPQILAATLPASALNTYIGTGWAHATSYGGGVVGMLVLWWWIWQQRGKGQSVTSRKSSFRALMLGCGLVFLALLWGVSLFMIYAFSQSFNDAYFPVPIK